MILYQHNGGLIYLNSPYQRFGLLKISIEQLSAGLLENFGFWSRDATSHGSYLPLLGLEQLGDNGAS